MKIQIVFHVCKFSLCMQIYFLKYSFVNGKARKFNLLCAYFSDTLIKERWKMIQKQTSKFINISYFLQHIYIF